MCCCYCVLLLASKAFTSYCVCVCALCMLCGKRTPAIYYSREFFSIISDSVFVFILLSNGNITNHFLPICGIIQTKIASQMDSNANSQTENRTQMGWEQSQKQNSLHRDKYSTLSPFSTAKSFEFSCRVVCIELNSNGTHTQKNR